MKRIIWIFLILVTANLISTSLRAEIDLYKFKDEESRLNYSALTKELRCPKCQNQDIADSNAPIASDMRREVHRLLEEGKSPAEVVDFMIDRFGEFVTYKPKVAPATYALWYGPWVLVFCGGLLIYFMIRRRTNGTPNEEVPESNPSEPASSSTDGQNLKVKALLDRYASDDKNSH